MRSYTRHQLKQDAFQETAVETMSWAVENRSKLVVGGIALAIILAIVIGGWFYVNYRDQQAQQQLAGALQKYTAPILGPGEPPVPGTLSYASSQDRAKAANADFTAIAGKYSFTQSGRLARYFAGITARDLGDTATAEKQLQDVAGSRHKTIAGLAKLALASLYQDTNQAPKAIEIYKDLMAHPTDSVGKATAEFQLAQLYEATNQPLEARKMYLELQKDSPTSPVGQMAAQRLRALGPQQ